MWVLNILFLVMLGGSFIFPFNMIGCGLVIDTLALDFFFVCLWVIVVFVFSVYFYFTGWAGSCFLTSVYLYFVGFFKTFLLNFVGCYSVLISNLRVFIVYCVYIMRVLWTWFGVYFHVWRPVFKRSGYAFLLNSSRARWTLSQSHNSYKNK